MLLPFFNFNGVVTEYPDYESALQVAMQLGRLDIVSVILTFLGILIGLFAIIGFGYITQKAEQVARETADEAATKRVDETLGDQVARHISLLAGEAGDQIAEHVDPENDNG